MTRLTGGKNMNWIKQEIKGLDLSEGSLRQFGFYVGAAFFVVGSVLFYFGRAEYLREILLVAGSLLVIPAYLNPFWLKYVYIGWMTIAIVLGAVMSRVFLTLIFFLAVMPVGAAARLFGKKFMELKADPSLPTYWVKKEKKEIDYEKMH